MGVMITPTPTTVTTLMSPDDSFIRHGHRGGKTVYHRRHLPKDTHTHTDTPYNNLSQDSCSLKNLIKQLNDSPKITRPFSVVRSTLVVLFMILATADAMNVAMPAWAEGTPVWNSKNGKEGKVVSIDHDNIESLVIKWKNSEDVDYLCSNEWTDLIFIPNPSTSKQLEQDLNAPADREDRLILLPEGVEKGERWEKRTTTYRSEDEEDKEPLRKDYYIDPITKRAQWTKPQHKPCLCTKREGKKAQSPCNQKVSCGLTGWVPMHDNDIAEYLRLTKSGLFKAGDHVYCRLKSNGHQVGWGMVKILAVYCNMTRHMYFVKFEDETAAKYGLVKDFKNFTTYMYRKDLRLRAPAGKSKPMSETNNMQALASNYSEYIDPATGKLCYYNMKTNEECTVPDTKLLRKWQQAGQAQPAESKRAEPSKAVFSNLPPGKKVFVKKPDESKYTEASIIKGPSANENRYTVRCHIGRKKSHKDQGFVGSKNYKPETIQATLEELREEDPNNSEKPIKMPICSTCRLGIPHHRNVDEYRKCTNPACTYKDPSAKRRLFGFTVRSRLGFLIYMTTAVICTMFVIVAAFIDIPTTELTIPTHH